MIDLIIPVYKNYKGLIRTLESINFKVFNVTVVDDASHENYSFKYPAHLIKLKKNVGPGQARQYGINHTKNDYIMFIDAGDIFVSKEIQDEIAQTIKDNPNTNIFFWKYYYKDEITTHLDNRLHGKVYKREFLNKYNIVFSKAGSYMNEDIGFNRTCRIIEQNKIKLLDKPVIKWITDENSLTQKNNNQSLYEKQTAALSINSIHCITTCYKNDVHISYIKAEINEIAVALYYWFIRTAAERPEFLSDAWNGAKIFYDRYSNEIDPKELGIGSTKIIKCLKYRDKIKFPINILRFVRDIRTYTKLPQWYKL